MNVEEVKQEKNRAEKSARLQIKIVCDNLSVLDRKSKLYALFLRDQKEPYHPYISKRGNKRHQLSDVEELYEQVFAGKGFQSVEKKEEKYNRFRR